MNGKAICSGDKVPDRPTLSSRNLGREDGSVVGGKLADELIYRVNYARYHSRQYIGERYQWRQANLLESYLRDEIGICLKIRCRLGETNPEELCAAFVDFDDFRLREGCDRGMVPVDVSYVRRCPADSNLVAERADTGKNNKEPVFINVVEFFDRRENRVSRSLGLTRLYGIDEFLRGGRNVEMSFISPFVQALRNSLVEV